MRAGPASRHLPRTLRGRLSLVALATAALVMVVLTVACPVGRPRCPAPSTGGQETPAGASSLGAAFLRSCTCA